MAAARGGQAKPVKAAYGVGGGVVSDKRKFGVKKTLSPVIDKRTAKQKMRDAQTRRSS